MNAINKQKFLAELGRLLTFMREEDRARALDLYGDIFDEVGNDTSVLQMLVSPTRQAVNLARAYDAKDRGGAGSEAAYLGVIEDIRRQADLLLPPMPTIDDSQLSLFNEPEQKEPAENVFESLGLDLTGTEAADGGKAALPEELSEGLSRFPDEDRAEDPASTPVPTPAPAPAPAPAPPTESSQEKTPEAEIDDFANSVAAFLADFGGYAEKPAAAESAAEEPAPAEEKPQSAEQEEFLWAMPEELEKPQAVEQEPVWTMSEKPETPAVANLPLEKKRVPIVGLLALFIVLAIPVGLAGIGVLLVPAALCLGLAALTLAVGFYGFVIAFTAFSVFADILLVFGVSLVLVAFGLLFFWAFVWLLAGVIPSLIRGLCGLIRKYCYKEVTV